MNTVMKVYHCDNPRLIHTALITHLTSDLTFIILKLCIPVTNYLLSFLILTMK